MSRYAYTRSVGETHYCPHFRETQTSLACLCRIRRLVSAVLSLHPPLAILPRLRLCLLSSPQDLRSNPLSFREISSVLDYHFFSSPARIYLDFIYVHT